MTFATWVNGLISGLNTIVVPVLFAFAAGAFLYGIAKYFIFNAADPKAREQGRSFALWGLLGMALLFSVWGLVSVLLSTLGLQ